MEGRARGGGEEGEEPVSVPVCVSPPSEDAEHDAPERRGSGAGGAGESPTGTVPLRGTPMSSLCLVSTPTTFASGRLPQTFSRPSSRGGAGVSTATTLSLCYSAPSQQSRPPSTSLPPTSEANPLSDDSASLPSPARQSQQPTDAPPDVRDVHVTDTETETVHESDSSHDSPRRPASFTSRPSLGSLRRGEREMRRQSLHGAPLVAKASGHAYQFLLRGDGGGHEKDSDDAGGGRAHLDYTKGPIRRAAVLYLHHLLQQKDARSAWRRKVDAFARSRPVDVFILGCICVNCIFLAIVDPTDTANATPTNQAAHYAEIVFTVIFTLEMLLRIAGQGFVTAPTAYLRDPWNRLDFAIVISGLATIALEVFSGASGGAVSGLRAFRLFKPLRAVTKVKEVQVIVNSLLQSLPQLVDVLLLTGFFLIIMGIVAVQMWKEELAFTCEVAYDNAVWGDDVLEAVRYGPEARYDVQGRTCSPHATHLNGYHCPYGYTCIATDNPWGGKVAFDNLGVALLTLFTVMTLEGWSDIMYLTFAASGRLSCLFFVLCTAFGSFFIVNLSLVIINNAFVRNVEVHRQMTFLLEKGDKAGAPAGYAPSPAASPRAPGQPDEPQLSPKRTSVVTFKDEPAPAPELQLLEACDARAQRSRAATPPPVKHAVRKKAEALVTSKPLVMLVTGAVVLNCALLGAHFHGQPQAMTDVTYICTVVFTVLYCLESALKLVAYPPREFVRDGHNLLELAVAVTGVLDLWVSGFAVLTSLRMLRLFRLAHMFPGFWRFILAIGHSVKGVAVLTLLLGVVLFIYALLGMSLFGGKYCGLRSSGYADAPGAACAALPRGNFDSLLGALLAVFQVITGEDWNVLMYDGMAATHDAACLYFVSLFVIGNYIVLNLFIAVLLEGLDSAERRAGEGGAAPAEDVLSMEDAFAAPFVRHTTTRSLTLHRLSVGGVVDFNKPLHEVEQDISRSLSNGSPRSVSSANDSPRSVVSPRDGFPPSGSPEGPPAPASPLNDRDGTASEDKDSAPGLPHTASSASLGSSLRKTQSLRLNGLKGRNNRFKERRLNDEEEKADAAPANPLLPQHTPPPPLPRERSASSHDGGPLPGQCGESRRPSASLRLPPSDPPPRRTRGAALFDGLCEGGDDAAFTATGRQYSASLAEDTSKADTHEHLGGVSRAAGRRTACSSNEGVPPFTPPSAPVAASGWRARVRGALRRGSENPDALFLFSPTNPLRRGACAAAESPVFEFFVIVLILASTVCLAIERPLDPPDAKMRRVLEVIGVALALLFTAEALLRIVAYGFVLRRDAYLRRDAWNVLDFLIVVAGLVDVVLYFAATGEANEQESLLETCRMFRILRPLRFINKSPGLKRVVDSLVNSVKGLTHVVAVTFMVFVSLAIMGMQFFMSRFHACTHVDWGDVSRGVACPHQELGNSTSGDISAAFFLEDSNCTAPFPSTAAECLQHSPDGAAWAYRWAAYPSNFDNLGRALISLFEIATLEGWVELMHVGIDSHLGTKQTAPTLNHQPWVALYFVLVIVVVAFFLVNLFVGVLLAEYDKAGETRVSSLTDAQAEWKLALGLLVNGTKPMEDDTRRLSECEHALRAVVAHKAFEVAISSCIALNAVVMASEHAHQDEAVEDFIAISSYCFIAIFTLEAILKIVAYRGAYFGDRWNRFDFIVVVVSLLGVVLSATLSFRPVLSVLRVLRLARLLRLARMTKGVRMLLRTLFLAMPGLVNVAALLALLFTLYAIMGVKFFGKIERGNDALHEYANFENFVHAVLLLFRMCTGEAWHLVMLDTRVEEPYCAEHLDTCGKPVFSWFYFLTFLVLGMFVMLNLIVAIILKEFTTATEEEAGLFTTDDIVEFSAAWERYDVARTGFVCATHLRSFLTSLGPPLGGAEYGAGGAIFELAGGLKNYGGSVYYKEVLCTSLRNLIAFEAGEDVDAMDLPFDMMGPIDEQIDQIFPPSALHSRELIEDISVAMIIAAVRVQALYRGWLVRRERGSAKGPCRARRSRDERASVQSVIGVHRAASKWMSAINRRMVTAAEPRVTPVEAALERAEKEVSSRVDASPGQTPKPSPAPEDLAAAAENAYSEWRSTVGKGRHIQKRGKDEKLTPEPRWLLDPPAFGGRRSAGSASTDGGRCEGGVSPSAAPRTASSAVPEG